MGATNKTYGVAARLAQNLGIRFSTLTTSLVQDPADGNWMVTVNDGSAIAGKANILVKVQPLAMPNAADLLGLTTFTQLAAPTLVQVVLEAAPSAAATFAVDFATTAALPAVTASGTGAGKTLTENANGALSIDGQSPAGGARVLVKNQVAGADNGIYTVTAAGSAGATFVLTRATDFDQATAGEIVQGDLVLVAKGTANAHTTWELTTSGAITVDTTALTFATFPASFAAFTAQQFLHIYGEAVLTGAIVELYASPAGAVPAASAIVAANKIADFRSLTADLRGAQ